MVKLWLFDRDPNHVVNLGIQCNGRFFPVGFSQNFWKLLNYLHLTNDFHIFLGSFGLNFNGVFSQPSRFVNGEWIPASDYMLPKDPQMSLKYLEEMAKFTMNLGKTELPKIVPYYPCSCKQKYLKKKAVS